MSTFRHMKNLVIRPLQFPSSALTSVRNIQFWVRPTILAFHKRKEAEEFKNVYPVKPRPRYEYTDWNYNAELYAFGKRLGENFNDDILRTALTDKSYIHQYLKQQEELGLPANQVELQDNNELSVQGMDFISGSVLSTLKEEFPDLPNEGIFAVSEWLTSQSALARICSLIGTNDLILCADYPPSEIVFDRVFKAIVAALVGSSGEERGRRFVIDLVLTQLCGKDVFELWDIPLPWTTLTELLKKKGQELPEPRIISQAGPNTVLAAYVVGLYDSNKQQIGKGIGETLEIAQEMAARDTLKRIYGLARPKNGFNFLLKSKIMSAEQSKLKSLS
ncbi:unnamed protein product [Allacma fusca]|uniref:39S ribosomal protein L44, mitochondrial n=1 Tax=Allacma fusca TaxID=39272 RepID=A0A8J2KPZ8_9HEXA|nr:unnamed protein product [Allacma fusca]